MVMSRYFSIIFVILLVGVLGFNEYYLPKGAKIGIFILENILPAEKYVSIENVEDIITEMRQNAVRIMRINPAPQVQMTMAYRLESYGYNVRFFQIDPQMIFTDPGVGVEIANRQGIDILIIGEAFASYFGKSGRFTYYRAIANLRVISTKNNQVLFTISATGIGRGMEPPDLVARKSLRDLGNNLADLFIPGTKKKITFACNVKEMEGMPHDITKADFRYYWLHEVKERQCTIIAVKMEKSPVSL